MERFTEQVVVKKNRLGNEILYWLSAIVMVLSGLMALLYIQGLLLQGFDFFTLIMAAGFAAIAVLLFLYRGRLRAEYEYSFTNGTLDFAMVFNNIKRKNLGSLNVKTVEAFGQVNSGSFHRYVTMPGVKQLRWFLNRDAELYYFFFQKDGNKKLLVFEPNEEMVECIKLYLPQGALQKN